MVAAVDRVCTVEVRDKVDDPYNCPHAKDKAEDAADADVNVKLNESVVEEDKLDDDGNELTNKNKNNNYARPDQGIVLEHYSQGKAELKPDDEI